MTKTYRNSFKLGASLEDDPRALATYKRGPRGALEAAKSQPYPPPKLLHPHASKTLAARRLCAVLPVRRLRAAHVLPPPRAVTPPSPRRCLANVELNPRAGVP